MMIEDMPANLKPAKDLGMTTVLVGPGMERLDGVVDHTIENILGLENILKNLPENFEIPIRYPSPYLLFQVEGISARPEKESA